MTQTYDIHQLLQMPPLVPDKAPSETRVVVAMSGGVDSSVVAAMLHDLGYDVVGVTLQLYDYGAVVGKKGACCAGQDIYDAKMVADTRGFPHYVLNYESNFKEAVMDDFADTYLRGETPIPCVRCNQRVKFDDLLKTAQDLNADVMATGHYIERRTDENGHGSLWRANDPGKDQSYFLFATTQEQIDFLRFPLGHMTKDQTRALAEHYGLAVSNKPDSQDICFVPDGDYAAVVKKMRPDAEKRGNIVHIDDNRILGEHNGIIHYTIGQRRGLKLGGGETQGTPLYVVSLRPDTNEVVVGPRESLARDVIYLDDTNWVGQNDLTESWESVKIKVRSNQQPMDGKVRKAANGGMEAMLLTPHYGISAGQACVCYDNERMLGGGWIKETKLSSWQETHQRAA